MPCGDVFAALRGLPPMRARIMEVCGTHTMSIARAGLRQLLPEGVTLLSGPGCPVCVTPASVIDAALELASLPGVTVATYGDMVRVPGSRRGDSLAARRTDARSSKSQAAEETRMAEPLPKLLYGVSSSKKSHMPKCTP